MLRLRLALILFVVHASACFLSAQTEAVIKTKSTDALTESIVVPTGKSITINSGATITNNGTASGFGSMATTDIDTSAELRAILTDESGTGALLFAGGNIGAASASSLSINGGLSSVSNTSLAEQGGRLTVGGSNTDGAEIVLVEGSGAGNSNFVGWKSPASVAADAVFTMPGADGSSGQALVTNGSKVLSFATVGVSDGDKGSITVSASGATWTIDSTAVTNAMLAGSIDATKITNTAAVLGAANTFSTAGATSASPILMSGAIMTGGLGTTNFPHLYISPSGATASTTLSTTGTALGVNLDVDAGNFADFMVDGVTRAKISATSGAMSVYTYYGLNWAVYDSVGGTLRSYEQGGRWFATDGFTGLVNDFSLQSTLSGLRLRNTFWIGWSADTTFFGTNDLIVGRDSAATLQLGADTATNSATATAQTIKAPDATGTTSTGGELNLRGGNGTGAGGAVTISTSPTTTPTERVRVSAVGEVFLNLPTSAGTTGSLWNDGGTVKVAP